MHESLRSDRERTTGTAVVRTETSRVSDLDILAALVGVHDSLTQRAGELTPDARSVLYDNLWELYL
jgi:hypothetical protein